MLQRNNSDKFKRTKSFHINSTEMQVHSGTVKMNQSASYIRNASGVQKDKTELYASTAASADMNGTRLLSSNN